MQARRRRFLIATGALLAAPLTRAQQARKPAEKRRIGVLKFELARTPEQLARSQYHSRFRARLKELGWIEGQNFVLEYAFAELKMDRLRGLAENLVRKRVDLIWASAAEAAVTAARATSTIPIVFDTVAWPVELGLIDSYARPGRNATGVATYAGIEVTNKRVQFLKEFAPTATRLSWILVPDILETVGGGRFDITPAIKTAAIELGFQPRFHFVNNSEDFDIAFAEILAWRAQVIAVAGSHFTYQHHRRIIEFANRHRLPAAYGHSGFVAAGGLLSYTADASVEEEHKIAEYIDRIFHGARPADLPVERPDRYELVINRKAANALGMKIPQSILLRADRVIE